MEEKDQEKSIQMNNNTYIYDTKSKLNIDYINKNLFDELIKLDQRLEFKM